VALFSSLISKPASSVKVLSFVDFMIVRNDPLPNDKLSILVMGTLSTVIHYLISHLDAASNSRNVLEYFMISSMSSVSEIGVKLSI